MFLKRRSLFVLAYFRRMAARFPLLAAVRKLIREIRKNTQNQLFFRKNHRFVTSFGIRTIIPARTASYSCRNYDGRMQFTCSDDALSETALTNDSLESNSGQASPGRLDPQTVAEVYRQFENQLGRFLIGMLRDESLAADVLQSTFAKLIEKGVEVNVDSRKAWLFQVAYNEAMMIRRREQTGRRATENVAWMMRVKSDRDKSGEGIQMAIEAENVERVRDALARLPEPIRDIVVLRIYEGLKFAEIATRLDVPLGTVLARMRSGLGKLKNVLKNL